MQRYTGKELVRKKGPEILKSYSLFVVQIHVSSLPCLGSFHPNIANYLVLLPSPHTTEDLKSYTRLVAYK